MNAVDRYAFFLAFFLLGTKHLHVLQWGGQVEWELHCTILTLPTSDLGHYSFLGHPNLP